MKPISSLVVECRHFLARISTHTHTRGKTKTITKTKTKATHESFLETRRCKAHESFANTKALRARKERNKRKYTYGTYESNTKIFNVSVYSVWNVDQFFSLCTISFFWGGFSSFLCHFFLLCFYRIFFWKKFLPIFGCFEKMLYLCNW